MTDVELDKIPEILQLLEHESVLLLGPPGVGKSQIVHQYSMDRAKRIAEQKGLRFEVYTGQDITPGVYYYSLYDSRYFSTYVKHRDQFYVTVDLRLYELDPTDLTGLPKMVNREGREIADYIPYAWAETLTEGYGTLFLDEFTNISLDQTYSVSLKIILDRQVGYRKLSDGIQIVAAGNPTSFSSLSRKLPAPVANRLAIVNVKEPSLAAWVDYIKSKYPNFNREVIFFLGNPVFKKYFLQVPSETEVEQGFPTPRAWEKVVTLPDLSYATYFVGAEAAMALQKFVKEKENIPNLNDLTPARMESLPPEKQLYVIMAIVESGSLKYIPLIRWVFNQKRELFVLMLKSMDDQTAQKVLQELFRIFTPEEKKKLMELTNLIK